MAAVSDNGQYGKSLQLAGWFPSCVIAANTSHIVKTFSIGLANMLWPAYVFSSIYLHFSSALLLWMARSIF